MSRKKNEEDKEYNIDFITDCICKQPQKLTNEELVEAIIIYRGLIEDSIIENIPYENENEYIYLESVRNHLNELKDEIMKRLSYYEVDNNKRSNDIG